jgi:hypothetical protein
MALLGGLVVVIWFYDTRFLKRFLIKKELSIRKALTKSLPPMTGTP